MMIPPRCHYVVMVLTLEGKFILKVPLCCAYISKKSSKKGKKRKYDGRFSLYFR
jgi:hypothetical protein